MFKQVLYMTLILMSTGCNAAPPAESRENQRSAGAALKSGRTSQAGVQSGIASWYGIPFHGRRTASGQVYDMNKLTAAHLTLPMSSRLMVRNPQNGKSILITVNDRGPYIKNRVIDLSREAARQLGILIRGIARIQYTVIPREPTPARIASVPPQYRFE